jgi:hypothetical protein
VIVLGFGQRLGISEGCHVNNNNGASNPLIQTNRNKIDYLQITFLAPQFHWNSFSAIFLFWMVGTKF